MDPITLAAIIGGGASLVSDIFNAVSTSSTNDLNERLMREAWARDDTAVQRRVADLRAAGLNPVLAAGSAAASSSPISLRPPQVSTPDVLSLVASVQAIKNQQQQGNLLAAQVDEAQSKAQIARNELQRDNTYMQVMGGDGVPAYLKDIFSRVTLLQSQAAQSANLAEQSGEVTRRERYITDYMQAHGLVSTSSEAASIAELKSMFDKMGQRGMTFSDFLGLLVREAGKIGGLVR